VCKLYNNLLKKI